MLLYKALDRKPQDRFESMAAFEKALEDQLLVSAAEPGQPVVSEAPALRAEKQPALQPRVEAETYDELEPTPVQTAPAPEPALREQEEPAPSRGKTRLPTWARWAGGIILVISLMVVGVGLRDRDQSQQQAAVALQPMLSETPALGIGSTMVNPSDGVVMVYVPEGEFLMGSEDQDAWDREKPEHTVYLDAYWISKHPVTNQEYRACVEAGECRDPGNTQDYSDPAYEAHPVRYVNWHDAQTYCEWAGGRLPTEAEWEKAARGTDGRRYPWGDENPTCSLANYSGCVDETTPVGSTPAGASPYGALDMAGNVWEWVADWYADDYYSRALDENPSGPDSGDYRVLRGGSWGVNEWYLRVSNRLGRYPGNWYNNNGFRCLLHDTP
jgi:formylglycine-generating enzyme required for sulfatase activity